VTPKTNHGKRFNKARESPVIRRDCWGFFPRKYRLVSLATWFKRGRGKIPQGLKIL